MDQTEFARLCHQTSVHLGLPDSDALGSGGVVVIDDIDAELVFDPLRCSAQLYCDLGEPKHGAREEVHEHLLELQGMFLGALDALFVRDPLGDRLLFTVRLPLHSDVSAESFAHVLTQLTGQVRHWKETVLAGKIADCEEVLQAFLGSCEDGAQAQRV